MAGSAPAVQATVTTSVRASKTVRSKRDTQISLLRLPTLTFYPMNYPQWVLPPRAKPGRKSKKDLAAAAAPAPSEDAADDDADYDKVRPWHPGNQNPLVS